MLLGKTIVITGVSSGIGAQTAALALSQGAEVIGIDINPPKSAIGFIQADMSSADSIDQAVRRLPKRIDALCNVAGLSGKVGAAKTLAVNFYGLRMVTELLAPRIREGGAVINVASIAGFGWRANIERAKALADIEGMPDVVATVKKIGVKDEECYPVSKEALLLWNYRAAHLPAFKDRGIRVNAVSPGPVETPILKEFREVLGDQRVDSDVVRVGRAGTSADIAPVIAFLCSDGARWINGANIAADGGLEASILAEVMSF